MSGFLERVGIRFPKRPTSEERRIQAAIPDAHAYISASPGAARVFQPWLVDPDIAALVKDLAAAKCRSLVNYDRLWILKCAVLQTRSVTGEIWEAGVYQGGTALFLKRLTASETHQPRIRLFDTFLGLPPVNSVVDLHHHEGEFGDTSLKDVQRFVGSEALIDYRPGVLPETFGGLDRSVIRLAHLDLDLYQGTIDALDFIYPRLAIGGMIVLDDYGFITCPGARRAVDEFFGDLREAPIILSTGQALVHRLPL